jgi:hypothetical protein
VQDAFCAGTERMRAPNAIRGRVFAGGDHAPGL